MEIKKLADDAILYHQYQGQTSPQDAYIEVDCDAETMTANWDGEIGGAVPFSVWHGRVRRYGINRCLPGDEVNALMDEIAPLVTQMLAGYSCDWDGNNMVGSLTEEASDVEQRIMDTCDECQPVHPVEVWDASEWWGPSEDEVIEYVRQHTDEASEAWLEAADGESSQDGGMLILVNADQYVEYIRERIAEIDSDD